jgi:ribose transport system ATP-binding protein
VGELSGGTQQKIAIARLLEHPARIFLLDEPTRGIDVGTKVEIYRIIGELAASGKAVLVVSSYLPELLGLCDTIGVMARGNLVDVRPRGEWTEEEILRVATGN